MVFVFITGPMKSGKSLELIARVEPFKFANKKILYLQPKKNVRESNITSRLGIDAEALVIGSLAEVDHDFDVVGIDEIHMFDARDASILEKWIHAGKDVFISGLDIDYQGKMIEVVQRVLELSPDSVLTKHAVCEVCHQYDARFTQILKGDEPVLEGISPVTPDDGTYQYETRCRTCFVKN